MYVCLHTKTVRLRKKSCIFNPIKMNKQHTKTVLKLYTVHETEKAD